MSSRGLPVLLWDMNGVLLDDEVVHEKCFAEILESFCGVQLTHEEYLDCFIGKTDALGMIDYFSQVEEDVNPDVISLLCGEKNRLYVDYFAQGLAVNPQALELLSDLDSAGYKQALVTCDQRPDVEVILERMLPNVFRSTITAQDVVRSKPYADPYEKAAAQIDVNPVDCIVVEDSVAGIHSARQAGAQVIGLCDTTTSQYARQLELAGASRVVSSLDVFSSDYFDRFNSSDKVAI